MRSGEGVFLLIYQILYLYRDELKINFIFLISYILHCIMVNLFFVILESRSFPLILHVFWIKFQFCSVYDTFELYRGYGILHCFFKNSNYTLSQLQLVVLSFFFFINWTIELHNETGGMLWPNAIFLRATLEFASTDINSRSQRLKRYNTVPTASCCRGIACRTRIAPPRVLGFFPPRVGRVAGVIIFPLQRHTSPIRCLKFWSE